jgi:Zn-finger nucleic acid-binding protein
MKCPHCADVGLLMTERQGIEIDYCPQCRGVWLDRGELDKLIERSAATTSASAAPPPQPVRQPERHPSHHREAHHHEAHHHDSHAYPHGKRRHKSWLSELFDD